MPFYPASLNITERSCVIVGGGEVAARKIEPLLACGARIRVISPVVCGKIETLAAAGRIEWVQRGYRTGDLQGAFLIFAATDNSDVQQQVIREAHELDILINSADTPDACTFQVPAAVRQGDLLIAVSTGGGSPVLAAWIRKRLEREFGPEYGLLLALFSAIRGKIVGDGDSSRVHKTLFERILALDVLSCIRNQDWPALGRKLMEVLPATIDVEELVAALRVSAPLEKNETCRGTRPND